MKTQIEKIHGRRERIHYIFLEVALNSIVCLYTYNFLDLFDLTPLHGFVGKLISCSIIAGGADLLDLHDLRIGILLNLMCLIVEIDMPRYPSISKTAH